jgi:hypothetical protein
MQRALLSTSLTSTSLTLALPTNAPEGVDLEAGLDIDFGSFSADSALDTNLLDASDSWLVSEDSEQPTDPVEALGDPFGEATDTIANSADLFSESLLDRSLDEPDIDAFAFDASSEKEALPIEESILPDIDAFAFDTSPDAASVAQPELTDALGDFFDQPNQLEESFDLPDDLLAIGVPSEPQSSETADTLSDELLGLTNLNGLSDLDDLNGLNDLEVLNGLNDLDDLNGLEPTAPLDENLALNDDLFELDEPELTNGAGQQPEPDHDAMAFDLFASTDTDATSAEFDAIASLGEDATDTPAITDSEASFDDENLDFDLFESDALNNTVPSQNSTAEASLSFGDDLFASNAPEDIDINVTPTSPDAESLNFGDALSFDFSDRNDSNGLGTENAGSEDFALDFETSDFDALAFNTLPADNAAATDTLFEAVPPEAATPETTAFDFETSDFDALAFDALPADNTAATDSLFEAASPEAATPETTAFDFDWEGTNDSTALDNTVAENAESEDFALDFETSDFDALEFDNLPADNAAAQTHSLKPHHRRQQHQKPLRSISRLLISMHLSSITCPLIMLLPQTHSLKPHH